MRLIYPLWSKGAAVLDAAMCSLGVFSRAPTRGSLRHSRRLRIAASEIVEIANVPDRFHQVTVFYLDTYETWVIEV
jgi:hypothetical protein